MSAAPKKSPVIILMFVVVAAVVAIASYQSGEHGEKSSSREVVVRERKERTVPANVRLLEPRSLVRLFPGGDVDEAEQWQNVRDLSLKEVKAAIAQLPQSGWDYSDTFWLNVMLFYRWGELEPAVADRAAAAIFRANPPPEGLSMSGFPHYRRALLTAWIKQGGAVEAWSAVKDEEEMWACTQSVPGEVADMIVASLSDRDDEAAFQEVLRLNDDNCIIVENLCRARAHEASKTPESRAEFLAAAAAHPDPYVRESAHRNLFHEWACWDVEAARTGAASADLTEEMRTQLEYYIQSGVENKMSDPEEADVGSKLPEAGSWSEVKDNIVKRWKASPSVMVDYRLREESRDLIAGTPESNLEAWFRELSPDHDVEDELRELIQLTLVQRCADRFVRSLATDPPIQMDEALKETMQIWTDLDPVSVKAWLERNDLPQAVAQDRDDYLEEVTDTLDRE